MKKDSNNQPLVSVLIRCFNQGDFIAQAIQSVQMQTHTNLEIIVIDDASSDESQEVISRLASKDERIKPIFNARNMGKGFGSAKTLNTALKAATGKYTANLDGDDFWLAKEKIEKQVAWLEEHPEYVLVGSFVQNVDINGNPLDQCEFAITNEDIKAKIIKHNQIAASSVLFKTETAKSLGGYPEKYKTSVDLGLWLRLGRVGKFYNFPYFWHGHRMTGVNIGETKRKQQLYDALRHVVDNRKYYPHFYQAFVYHLSYVIFFSLPSWLIELFRKIKNNN